MPAPNISRDRVTKEINADRRRFLGSVMRSAVTARFGITSRSATPLATMSAVERLHTARSNPTFASVKLMDALGIQRAILGGCDWGSRTAAIMAALWPDRVKALVAVSGYLIVNLSANLQPLPSKAELGWWYQYYFATERGVRGYAANTYDFNKLIWQIASPKWAFDQDTFDRIAASFNNPDHVKIVIHNYRWRLSLMDGETKYRDLEQKLFERPPIALPTITIASDFDGAAADGRDYASKFTGRHSHRVLSGIGHNVPQEDPAGFAKAIVDVDGY